MFLFMSPSCIYCPRTSFLRYNIVKKVGGGFMSYNCAMLRVIVNKVLLSVVLVSLQELKKRQLFRKASS